MSLDSSKTGGNLPAIIEDFGACPKQPTSTKIFEDTGIVPPHPSVSKSSGLPENTLSNAKIENMRKLGL